MYKSIILPLAQQDIKEAAQWYNERQPGLGKRFIALVRQKVHFIRQNPQAVAIRYDNIRTAMLDTFPYMIHYSVDDERKLIIVATVLSTSRDSGIWQKI